MLQEFDCTNCQKHFKAGDWNCASGEVHTVAPVTYYLLDAPHDHNDRIHARTIISNVIPETQITRGNDIIRIPGTAVEFVRGRLETSDPQIQMRLNTRNGVFRGDEGFKRWQDNYLTNEEKNAIDRFNLKDQVTRLEQERNDLLAKVKADKSKPREAVSA